MRTTIELRDDQRPRLLEMAAQEGRKRFSHLIQEAVDRFLAEEFRGIGALPAPRLSPRKII